MTAHRHARDGPPATTEEAIHRAVVELLARAARPGVAWTHMPAGEARAKGVGGKLKGMGVQAGWPDIVLVRAGRLFGLELKTPTGRVSPAQRTAHASLSAAGAIVRVCYGLDPAIETLRDWEMVR